MNTRVTYTLADGVATLHMDDGKANAMGIDMLAAINEALDRAEKEAKVVVLQGRDGVFSAGFDLKVFARGGPDVATMLDAGLRLCARLVGYPLPVIAVCTGHALALGAILLNCCDARIGTLGAFRIQINEVRIGMTLPLSSLEALRRKLAPAHFQAATNLGIPFTPESALVAGFFEEVVAADALQATVARWSADLASFNTATFTSNKRRVNEATLAAMNAALEVDVAGLAATGAKT